MILKKQIPNLLTLSRIIAIPLILAAFYFQTQAWHIVAASIFTIASITDFFDGYLARTWKIQSKLGRFLDPIADKLLVGSSIIVLVRFGFADVIPAVAIICREILVSGLREFLADLKISVPVTSLAKIKTGVQMTAIGLLLLGNKGFGIEYTELLGAFLLWVAAALTLITGYAYLRAGLKHMD